MGRWGDGGMGRQGGQGDIDQTTNDKQQTTNNKQQTTNLQ